MKITKEIEDRVIEMYLDGVKIKTIIEKTRVCETSITNIMKRNEIPDRKTAPWTNDEDDYLRKNYPNLGIKDCAAHLSNRSISAIKNRIKKLNIFLLSEVKTKILEKCHEKPFEDFNVNPEQFLNIQTPEVAYILGFLWAEGTVKKKYVTFHNVEKDVNDIEEIFFSTGNWRKYTVNPPNRQTISKFFIGNIKIAKILLQCDYGIKSDGASACKILSKIPDHLKHYWWRGYFDGDGHIAKNRYYIKLSSCYNQNWDFVENLFKSMNIKYCIKREKWWNKKDQKWNQASCIYSCNAKDVMKFLKYIYQDYEQNKYGLTRKHSLFLITKDRAETYFERGTFRTYNQSKKV